MQADNSSRRFWLQYGDACRLRNQLELAEQAYLEALKLGETFGIWYRLGQIHCQALKFREAIEYFKRADQCSPDQPDILFELARAYYENFELEAAIANYQRVLHLDQTKLKCWFYLAACYQALGKSEQAKQCLNNYLTQSIGQPDVPASDIHLAKCNLRLLEMPDQDFLEIWRLIADIHHPNNQNPAARSSWSGTIETTTQIQIIANGGMGDIIQMLRFLPALTRLDQDYRICINQPSSWKRLLQTMISPELIEELVPHHTFKRAQLHEGYLPIMNIPLLPNIQTAHAQQFPYLSPVPGPEHLLNSAADRPKIGLVWASGHGDQRHSHWRYQQRSVGLALFSELILSHPELAFYSLQYGSDAQQLAAWPQLPIENLAPRIHDLYDTACLIQQLDLVISVDTAVAHLTGALGKPLWLLLPLACDERWGKTNSQTAWYPSARLFRQSVPFNWHSVLTQLQSALAEFSSLNTQRLDQPKSL